VGSPAGVAHRAQRAHEQQELLEGGLLVLHDQPLGGLEHHGAGGVLLVARAEPPRERVERDRLGDHVERAALGELQVDVRERLQPRPEA
jgi:hypothetical protein